MAGYSGTPLPKKLGIKEGASVALLGAPGGFERDALASLPDDVTIEDTLGSRRDVVVYFTKERAHFEADFAARKAAIDWDGGLWIAWPKRASKVPTDMTEDVVREVGLPGGLVDNKVCAIDAVWSGLRLVYRKADRPRRPKPTRARS